MIHENAFGQAVRQRRRSLDLTQEELARRVGCAAVTLRKIEAGDLRPSQQIAERLAMALAVPLEERADFVRQARSVQPGGRPIEPTPTPQVMPEEIGLEDLSGRAIRGYQLGEKIGAGAFGAVYRAVQPLVEREVAVKIILPQYANHPDFIRRFEAEAQLVARLEHPHIVPLYDYWREPGVAYLVMRLLRGGNVHKLLEHGPLALDDVTRLMEQIGGALHTAHRAGVVHRDLKPSNVLLDEDCNVYLADFGIAKNLGNPNLEDQTQAGVMIGSPAYMSPEQISAEPIRPQADIYSLGVMLYELLTGTRPFLGPTPLDLIQQHLYVPLPPLASNKQGLPAAFDDVIARATDKDPLQRYADVDLLLADFKQVIQTGRLAATPIELAAPVVPPFGEIVNPYKGLRPFEEADAPDFFGREALTQQLLARLAEGGDLARFLAVIGPSGSGKSSVVGAGLMPALRRGGLPHSENWFIVEVLPGPHPLEELEAALLRVAVNPPESLLTQIKEDRRGLLRAVNRCLPADDDIELVLVLDQFEEVFTLVDDEAERAHLLDSLVEAVLAERSRVRVVVTLRADFIDKPLRYVDFGELLKNRSELVLPLTPDEMEQAIGLPAEHAGLQIGPGLMESIIGDVTDQPGALPLLQYALTELVEQRTSATLSRDAYQAIGGVRGALGRRAEEAYQSLDAGQHTTARQIFLRLVTLGEGTEDVRRRVLRSELETLIPIPSPIQGEGRRGEGGIASVLDAFGNARLLTFDRDLQTRGSTVEVAHEALLREWSRLREWLNDSRADVRAQRLLAAATIEWLNANRDASYLLQGARLAQFEGWAQTTSLALTHDERAFLDTSIAERQTREAAEAKRHQRELEAAQKLAETESRRAEEQTLAANRLRTRNRVIAVAGALVTVVALIAIIFAGQANANSARADQSAAQAQTNLNIAQANAATAQVASVRADTERDAAVAAQATAQAEAQIRATQQAVAETNFIRSEGQRLGAESNVLLKSNARSDLIALLALRSLNLQYSPQGDAALTGAAALDYPLHIFEADGGGVFALALSPDGKYILSGNDIKVARLLEVQTGRELHRLVNGKYDVWGAVAWATFSPDSRYVVTHLYLTGDGFLGQLWDVQTGQLVRQFDSPSYCHMSFFSMDGKELWMGCQDAKVRIYDWQTGQLLRTLSLPLKDDQEIWAITADGRYALTRTWKEYTMRLWSLEGTISELSAFPFSSNETPFTQNHYAASPDAKYVLVGDQDGATHLYETGSGKEIRTFKNNGAVTSVTFSPDSKTMLISSMDQTTRLLDVQTGEELRQIPQSEYAWGAAFSPDGNSVLLGALTGLVRVWDVRHQPELPVFKGHTDAVGGLAFSPDGKYLATGGIDGLRLWNVKTGQPLRVFSDTAPIAWGVKFSPDGKYLLSGNITGIASLWDVQTGAEVQRFVHPPTIQIYSVDFSPDGKSILTGGPDFGPESPPSRVQVWDIQTGKVTLRLNIPAPDPLLNRVTFSPDGQYILTAHGNPSVARLWDAKTGREIRQFAGHMFNVNGAVFSPDGKYLATASGEGIARLWDVQTGQELRSFLGHSEIAYSVTFSPDGKYLATASADRTARLWDVQTGQELRRFIGHEKGVENVAFSPDGKHIATVSDDGTARLWDVDYHTTMQYLCSRLLRDFTDDERKQYGITDNAPTCPKP